MRLFVDHLINVDFSYLDQVRGLLGETWIANTELEGKLDEQGMVCDFGIVKKTLRNWLDDEIDHRLLVPTGNPALESLETSDDRVAIVWRLEDGELITCNCPKEAVHLVDTVTITPESVAESSVNIVKPLFRQINAIHLSFVTERIEGAQYQYSHGLKKHNGNCQRIAHGHRSRIGVWKNGEVATDLEAQWASTFRDIYLGTREDLTTVDQDGYLSFAYESQQGAFSLKLPEKYCYLMDSDTTVEHIASHIAKELKSQSPTDTFIVKAYEGLNKGAIAQS